MKIFTGIAYSSLLIGIAVLMTFAESSQTYPFQDASLSDDARLDSLISLMTLEEKINNLSPMLPGIPRLGVRGTRIVEGLHGLAWSGPANWAVKGKGEAPTTTFPQAIGLAQMWDPELLRQVAAWLHDANIAFYSAIMIGFPGETLAGIRSSIE